MVKNTEAKDLSRQAGLKQSVTAAVSAGLIAAALVAAPNLAAAESTNPVAENSGSKARINMSARLRSLTEDVAATSCRLMSGTQVENDDTHLETIVRNFDDILNGLENGDNRFGIPTAENRSGLKTDIQSVRDQWKPIQAAATRLLDGAANDEDRDILRSSHRELLELTQLLASDISGVYSDPLSLLQADAVTLNFLGRQRSLATRFARTTCGVNAADPEVGTEAELKEAMQLFDVSYGALMNGMPAAGVSAPPSEAVSLALTESYDNWLVKKDVLEKASAGGEDIVKSSATFASNAVRETNNAITLYILASPGQSDVFQSVLKSYTEDQLLAWLEDPLVIKSIMDQNGKHAGMAEDAVIALDNEWRAEAKGADGDMISSTLTNPLSQWLAGQASDTAGIVTEVFVMDNLGLNVGQSAQTSDFWQGDEAKWSETYGAESDDLHISELEFDESSGSYQTQASKIIRDPATGDAIGAVTFGINVVNLM